MAEEEGQHQGADMRSVHIRVGHDDDFVVTKFFVIHIFPHSHAHGRNHVFDFLAGQHAVETGALHVQDLAAQG